MPIRYNVTMIGIDPATALSPISWYAGI